MAWPFDDNLTPDVYQRMMNQVPSGMPQIPPVGMTMPPQRQITTYPDAMQQTGLPESGRGNMGMLLPLMLTQIGAALMQPPNQRAQVFATMPATMLAAAKMNSDSALERAKIQAYRQMYGKDAEKNLTSDQYLTQQMKLKGITEPADITEILQGKKAPGQERQPTLQTRYNPQTGLEEKVQWNPDTGGWDVVGGQKVEKTPPVGKTEFDIVTNALTEKLGRPPTAQELDQGILDRKKQIAVTGAQGKLEGGFPENQRIPIIKSILSGKSTLDDVTNTFGIGAKNAAMAGVLEVDPNYDFIQAKANRQWYQSPTTQRLIRRTESIVAPGGPIDESIRLAQEVGNPAGTPLNAVTGKVGVALGNSKRQLLDLVHGLSAEEVQQIMGAQGGGERFLEFTRQLSDPNQSVEQYVNAAKEMRYLILTRQLANVRGTPEQGKWENIADKYQMEIPYVRADTLKEYNTGKQDFLKPKPAGSQQVVNPTRKLGNISTEDLLKMRQGMR